MADVLIYADTIRSPELRHEVPLAVPDPFVYVERNGNKLAYVGSLEIPRMSGIEGLTPIPLEQVGLDELVAKGMPWHELALEVVLRACRHAGVEQAVTPREFPLEAADFLRAHGIDVTAQGELFDRRRRSKTEAEVAGIRRALGASEAAMDAVRARLRSGGEVTCEDLRGDVMRVFSERGVVCDDLVIVSHGEQTAVGHEPGYGPVAPGEPVVVDLYPRDPDSGCYSDMTRTFAAGEPPEELRRYHALCREALDITYPEIRPGVTGAELHRRVCDFFAEHGFATQLTKEPGEVLDEGFYHSLGHGVGLDVHELPSLGRTGEALVAGDVLAVEPGLYRRGFGGCRLEDLVLVTEDGCEVLTDYPYELEP